MPNDRAFVDYVIEQLALGPRLSQRRLFGEMALYVDEKVVLFLCDDSVYLKPTAAAAQLAPGLPQRPPYPGAKDYPVLDELLDDGERLRALVLASVALLPLPKPKSPRKPRPRGAA